MQKRRSRSQKQLGVGVFRVLEHVLRRAALDILVDGEFVLAQRNLDLRFRGSENQRILDVPQSLAQGRAVWCTAARWVGERQS